MDTARLSKSGQSSESGNAEQHLSGLIEKIVEQGKISRSQQEEINQLARYGFRDSEDFRAVSDITRLITEGKISVEK